MTHTLTAAVDAGTARVILTATYTAGDTTPAVLLERSEDGGNSWNPVRGDLADGLVSMLGGTVRSFPDAEADLDTNLLYRASKASLTGVPSGTTFDLSSTVRIYSDSTTCFWWIHPIFNPAHLYSFVPAFDNGGTFAAPRGVFYPIGTPTSPADFDQKVSPVVTLARRQTRQKASFGLVIRSNAETVKMMNALGPASIICVRTPAAHGWATRYLAVGDIGEKHPTPIQAGAWVYTFPYTDTLRPTLAVVQQYGASYDDLALAYATYGTLDAAYGTYDAQTRAII